MSTEKNMEQGVGELHASARYNNKVQKHRNEKNSGTAEVYV